MAEEKKTLREAFDISFLIFSVIAIVGATLCVMRGEDRLLRGFAASRAMALEIAPRIVPAFLLAGFVQVLVPKDVVMKWIGEESGLKGIIVSSCAGILTPGGPIISFPLVSALHRMGADYGSLVAYLAAWELLGLQRIIVWELPFMGIRFVLLRGAISLAMPVIAGIFARRLVRCIGTSYVQTDE